MSAPAVRGPRDVPALRDWMLLEWFPGNAFALSAPWHPLGRKGTESETNTIIAWNLMTLRDSELWWVDEPMCELLAASSVDLPPVTLRNELVPVEPVLAILEKSIVGVDADQADRPIQIDAIMWGYSQLAVAGPSVGITMYQRLDLDAGLSGPELGRGSVLVMEEAHRQHPKARPGDAVRVSGEVWVPVGRSHWVIGRDWNDPVMVKEGQVTVVDSVTHASMAEDRRWLATLWSLATTPQISTVSIDHGHRPDRRRREREGLAPPTVKVVNLRRIVRPAGQANGDGTGRHLHVRFPVKGHWRQQAYGPKLAYRKPVYIEPYIKGPADAPLQGGATVRRLR